MTFHSCRTNSGAITGAFMIRAGEAQGERFGRVAEGRSIQTEPYDRVVAV
jgi:hypothetical protein